MANFVKRLKSAIAAYRFDPLHPPEKYGGHYWLPLGGNSRTFSDQKLLNDYQEIPEVSAIVGMKAKAFSKMVLRIVSKKTGEEAEDAKNYEFKIRVLRNPNWFQSQKEFMMQTKTYREIWGNEYIYLNYPFGMPSRRATAMYSLPANLMTTTTPAPLPFYLQIDPTIQYEFLWGNQKYPIDKDNIVHLNDNRVDVNKDNWVDGQSWLAYQRACCNNIRSAYEARGFIIDNIGVQGILTNAGTDVAGTQLMDEGEREDLKKRLADMRYNKGKFPAIITSLALDWKKISVDNPASLGLFEEIRNDFYKLCDAAGTPSELFGSDKGTTFENQKWAERRLYENTIIPEAEEWIGAMNSQFETENEAWEIVGSYTHLNIFQENLKERAQSVKMMTDALSIALRDGAILQPDYQHELRRMGLVIGVK